MTGRYKAYSEYKESNYEWLGDVPSHWDVTYSKWLFSERNNKANRSDEMLTASQKYGVIPQKLFMKLEQQKVVQVQKGHDILKQVKRNDFVISMRSFQGGIEFCEYNGAVSSAYVPLEPKNELSLSYFKYLFKSKPYIQALQATTNLVRDGQALRYNNFLQAKLPIPQHNEAEKIGSFLDHETAKIDILITKQEKLIELLKEKRQAVISHAVTKGLNPDASMKDSGVEWLGEVPEHWGVTRFKFLCENIIAGPFGSSITKDMYVKSGFRVYGQEQVIPNDFNIGDYFISAEDYLSLARYKVNTGDVLISCVGTFGKVAVFPPTAQAGIINPRLIKTKIHKDSSPYFIREYLKSVTVAKQFDQFSRGGTMGVINIAILNEIVSTKPPYAEQFEICDFIKVEKSKFSLLLNRCEKQIALLKERKTALISAAVTGKIDVRDWSEH
ncbi:restriction endonuclease subunit S [Vibrio splendidus]